MNPESIPSPKPSKSSRSGRGVAWFACLLAIFALAGMVYLGWQQRLNQHAGASLSSHLQAQVAEVSQQLDQLQTAGRDLEQHVSSLNQRDQGTADLVQGMDQRMRTLENAVARISEKTLSVHDGLVLDQVESLLLTAQQRLDLFHDATGALSAYRLAAEALGQLGGPQLVGVRTLLQQEQAELVKSQPAVREDALSSLASLRSSIPSLALQSDQPAVASGHGFWARIWSALSQVVSVRHAVEQPLLEQDASLTRELTELDLVEAQAALLSDNRDAYQQALQRLQQALHTRFDLNQTAVKQTAERVDNLLQQVTQWQVPQLGGALAALRDLRRVQGSAQPATAGSAAPAPVASAAAPAQATSTRPQP